MLLQKAREETMKQTSLESSEETQSGEADQKATADVRNNVLAKWVIIRKILLFNGFSRRNFRLPSW